MAMMGVLETMARADLDAVLREIVNDYRPGALDALTATDPGWRATLDRTEQELGGLYEALCDADATLIRWRRALVELARLWARVAAVQGAPAAEPLDEVA